MESTTAFGMLHPAEPNPSESPPLPGLTPLARPCPAPPLDNWATRAPHASYDMETHNAQRTLALPSTQ